MKKRAILRKNGGVPPIEPSGNSQNDDDMSTNLMKSRELTAGNETGHAYAVNESLLSYLPTIALFEYFLRRTLVEFNEKLIKTWDNSRNGNLGDLIGTENWVLFEINRNLGYQSGFLFEFLKTVKNLKSIEPISVHNEKLKQSRWDHFR